MDECLLQPLCSMGGCAAPPRPSAEHAGEEQEADHVCCCKPANFRIFRPWKIQIGNFQKAGLKLWYLEAVRKVLWSALYGGGNTGTSRVLSIPAACQGSATDKQGAAESPPPHGCWDPIRATAEGEGARWACTLCAGCGRINAVVPKFMMETLPRASQLGQEAVEGAIPLCTSQHHPGDPHQASPSPCRLPSELMPSTQRENTFPKGF